MASIKTCDICGGEAIAELDSKTNKTTPIKLDICEDCLAEYKKIMREFTGQELANVAPTSI
jgi:hypothetical protein